MRAEELTNLGIAQYGYRTRLEPKRGEIKTSDDYALAANKVTYLLYANPKVVTEQEKTAMLLSPLLNIDAATISALLSVEKFWVPIKSRLDENKKQAIEKLKLNGIGFDEQATRMYPEASMAAKLLGFVGKADNGEDHGYFGLEGYYERQLRGKSGIAIQIHDALGNPILAKANERTKAIDGRNLILHVDRVAQFIMEDELKKGIEKYGALSGMAAAMDPKSGNILAMAAFPTYDPRDYKEYSDKLYRNPFISDAYEPGSTFKPLVMAAAIDSGLLKPETRCPICDGPVQIGEYQIKTWNDQYNPNETMTEVIQHSDNTGMVYTARLLGLKRLLSYFTKYGIGEMTGIDLQGEVVPPLRAKDNWYPIDLATASFGQGISMTPIQLLSAFSAIANNGIRMEPHIVAKVETGDGEVIPIPPKILSQPISEKTARIMTEMLVNAVDKGEAKWAKPKGYRIAGKTGTAQIPIEGHYDKNQTIPSFIGFAPADNPKFLMLVVLDRPQTSIYGSETAAPIFFNIATKYLTYYGIPPTVEPTPEEE